MRVFGNRLASRPQFCVLSSGMQLGVETKVPDNDKLRFSKWHLYLIGGNGGSMLYDIENAYNIEKFLVSSFPGIKFLGYLKEYLCFRLFVHSKLLHGWNVEIETQVCACYLRFYCSTLGALLGIYCKMQNDNARRQPSGVEYFSQMYDKTQEAGLQNVKPKITT